eukprot:TRINITY_DN940_c0_g1_i5.p1 TRINITY_DN940_c0_g1~~TRINITY_DN940_c0_g1_i5.p1  ORF type:complete len:345 (+),score=78.41 TRINITY_DN940_c0_g1_i5:101-1135(+)
MRPLILLSILALSLVQAQTTDIPGVDFIDGLLRGLHLGKLSPSFGQCLNSSTEIVEGIGGFIQAYEEGQDSYNLTNNFTLAIKPIPKAVRGCLNISDDLSSRIEEIYMKPFNYSLSKYLRAVGLNAVYRLDEIVVHWLDIQKANEEKNYFALGYNIGELVNIVLNVTKPDPIPDPPSNLRRLLSAQSAYGLGAFHDDFKFYFKCAMVGFNATRWVNATTFSNLNESVSRIELHFYNSFSEFAKPNIKEGILQLVDILSHLNQLFNGAYFSVQQTKSRARINLVIDHPYYWWLNFVQHSGYFYYHGKKLMASLEIQNYFDVTKRVVIIARQLVYFDRDVLDDIVT